MEVMQHHQPEQTILGSYSCRRSQHEGRLEILNENNYVMGVYNRSTGVVSWERLVLATQREAIQRWFAQYYPVTKRVEPTVGLKSPRRKAS
jgi:hypothetical protein